MRYHTAQLTSVHGAAGFPVETSLLVPHMPWTTDDVNFPENAPDPSCGADICPHRMRIARAERRIDNYIQQRSSSLLCFTASAYI